MRLARHGEATAVVMRYASQPWGAVQVARPDRSGMPEVLLTNPGGGTLGGDRLDLRVEVGPGARATVCTQGAAKAYRGTQALQRTRLSVGAGGLAEYVPHHVIPYAESRWRQETVVELAADARLLAWEAFAAGRLAHGERFSFAALAGRTLIVRDGAPEVIDGLELAGGGEPFGGWPYLATVHLLAPAPLEALARELHTLLEGVAGVWGSASAPVEGVLCARLVAGGAPALAAALNALRARARTALGCAAPAREVV